MLCQLLKCGKLTLLLLNLHLSTSSSVHVSSYIKVSYLGLIFPCITSVQFSSVAQLCPTLCNPMDYSTPCLPFHHQHRSLLKLRSIELVIPSNHLILCRPLLPPSIFPNIRVFSDESVLCIRWPKY